MLDFLFGPETVEFVELEDRKMTFQSKKGYKKGQTIRIRTVIPTEEGPETVQVPVSIVSCRKPESGKMFIVVGEVPGGNSQLMKVRMTFDAQASAEKGAGQRRRPRHKLSLRLLSKDLPGFKAISVDFNALGLQIQTEGPVPEGKELVVQMELDSSNLPKILARAVVRWVQQLERKRFLIGLEFMDLPAEIEKELEEFEKFVVQRQTGEVFQRTIMNPNRPSDFELTYAKPEMRSVTLGETPPPPG